MRPTRPWPGRGSSPTPNAAESASARLDPLPEPPGDACAPGDFPWTPGMGFRTGAEARGSRGWRRWSGPGGTGIGRSSLSSASSSRLPGRLPASPSCPFCEGKETELHSLFGSHASVTTFWCRSCRSPFEHMKWTGRQADDITVKPRTRTRKGPAPPLEPTSGRVPTVSRADEPEDPGRGESGDPPLFCPG
jgi:hypothetical protein